MQTQEFSVVAIERELEELWQQMAKASQKEQEQAVIRTCVLNLVVYAPGKRSEDEISQIMVDVSIEHPSRIIVILPGTDADKSLLSGWVTAVCHLAPGGRKQVCCEQIIIRAEGEGLIRAPSIIPPLVIPDLPVVLWWRDTVSLENEIFLDLVHSSDRIIIDSGTFAEPLVQFQHTAKLMEKEKRWRAFSDLNWARLNPWRLSVAKLYDVPDFRPFLARLSRIEIGGFDPEKKTPSTQSLILACWIASRLNWKKISGPITNADSFEFSLSSENGPVSILIKTAPEFHDGIHSIQLVTEGRPSSRFDITISSDRKHLETQSSLEGAQHTAHTVIRLPDNQEAELLCSELEILGHDRVYEQAVRFCADLG